MTSGSERGRKLWTGLFIGALRFLLSLSFRCVLLSLSVTASFDYLFLVFFSSLLFGNCRLGIRSVWILF